MAADPTDTLDDVPLNDDYHGMRGGGGSNWGGAPSREQYSSQKGFGQGSSMLPVVSSGYPDAGSLQATPGPVVMENDHPQYPPITQSQYGSPVQTVTKRLFVDPSQPTGMSEESLYNTWCLVVGGYVYMALKVLAGFLILLYMTNIITLYITILFLPCFVVVCFTVDAAQTIGIVASAIRSKDLFFAYGMTCLVLTGTLCTIITSMFVTLFFARIIIMSVTSQPGEAVAQFLFLFVDYGVLMLAVSVFACSLGIAVLSMTNGARIQKAIKDKSLAKRLDGAVRPAGPPQGTFDYNSSTADFPQFRDDDDMTYFGNNSKV